MRAIAIVLLFLCLIPSTGCKTTGGKVFGTVGLAAAAGGVYLLSTSASSIENGELITHDDRELAGSALLITAVVAGAAWAVSELVIGERPRLSNWGGGGISAPAPAVAPALEPAPVPEPALVLEGNGGPTVIVVHEGGGDGRGGYGRGGRERGGREQGGRAWDPIGWGWSVEPDGGHALRAPDGALIGRIDREGQVWDGGGAYRGRVDLSPGCGAICQRAQAGKLLRESR